MKNILDKILRPYKDLKDGIYSTSEINYSKTILLYDRPYNQNVPEKNNIIRVYNFDDVLNEVEKLSVQYK